MIRSAFICLKGTVLHKEEADVLRTLHPAGLTLFKRNVETPEQVKKLTDDIRDAAGVDDFLIAIDQEGGMVRRLRPPYWHEYVAQQQLGSLPKEAAEEAVRLHARLIANDLRNLPRPANRHTELPQTRRLWWLPVLSSRPPLRVQTAAAVPAGHR